MNNQSNFNTINLKYYSRFFYFLLFLCATVTYLVTNELLPNSIDPKIFLDDYIPLIPCTIFIYHLWYPGIIVLIYKLRFYDDFDEMLKLIAISMTICVLIYKIIPFEVSVRPDIIGDSFSKKILALTYQVDAPSSSMPSSHVVLSCIAFHYSRKHRIYALSILNFLIPFVTLTTKQHVILDVLVAIIFSFILLFIINRNKIIGGKNGIYYNY